MKAQKHTASRRLHKTLITVFLFMLCGTAIELILLGHVEDNKQLLPLICIGSALVFLVLLLVKPLGLLKKLFKMVMVCTALTGVYGTYLHLVANYEFEQEMRPSATSWQWFKESLSGALPALAPCSMLVLALLGYAYLLSLKHHS